MADDPGDGEPTFDIAATAAALRRAANDIEAATGKPCIPPGHSEPAEGLALARALLDLRRRRDRLFSARLFGEPAWDILLDLYIARLEGRAVSVSSACAAGAVPSTTGLRWLTELEREGLVVRAADPHDGRRVFVALSDDAVQRLGKLLNG